MSVQYADQLHAIDEIVHESPDLEADYRANRNTIERILELRDEKNVLILGHNYMKPLVYLLSGEGQRGDSLELSRFAAQSENPIILFDGVRFMAETAKILNPDKKVLIADLDAGCSLADPFSADDVLEYRKKYPGIPVVTYVNSYAEIKAESDYCCTSANGMDIVRHAAREFNTDRVIFFPDALMGQNIQNDLREEGSGIEIIYPGKYDDKFGRCEVHEKLTVADIRRIRREHDIPRGSASAAVLVHWECPPDVLKEADFYGSTSQMIRYIRNHPELERVYLGTECEMSANLANEFPSVEFVRTCQIYCQHMRKITLDKIRFSLENEVHEVTVPEDIRRRALVPIERMLAVI